MRYLTINRCPTHEVYSVSIDDEGGGTRLTPGKCCGRWIEIGRWPMTAARLREIANEIECNADQLEHEVDEKVKP